MRSQLHVVSAKKLPLAIVGRAKGSQEQISFYSTEANFNLNFSGTRAKHATIKDVMIEESEYPSTIDAPKRTCTEQRQPLPFEIVNTAVGENFASDEGWGWGFHPREELQSDEKKFPLFLLSLRTASSLRRRSIRHVSFYIVTAPLRSELHFVFTAHPPSH